MLKNTSTAMRLGIALKSDSSQTVSDTPRQQKNQALKNVTSNVGPQT